MSVDNGNHYVLAYGEAQGSGKYKIDDPGHRNYRDLSPYHSIYDGIFAYSSTQTPPQALLITGHSPIELILTDASGNKTGFDPVSGQAFDEIPNASYRTERIAADDDSGQIDSEIKVLEVPLAPDGTYMVRVTGTGRGPYTLDFRGYDSNAATSVQSVNGMASMGSVAEFQVDYSATPGSQVTVAPVLPQLMTQKQTVLQNLQILRGAADKDAAKKLNDAIKHLKASLDTTLWRDEAHLQLKSGDMVFNEEKDAVAKLRELAADKKKGLPVDQLRRAVDVLTSVDRQLAQIALDEAISRDAKPPEIRAAQAELAKGDTENNPESAIEHYRNAWQHAVRK